MQNDKGEYVDLYIPRRCYATNRLLDSKDHASVQVTVSTVSIIILNNSYQIGLKQFDNKKNENQKLTMVLSGFVRAKGNADAALNKYLKQKGLITFN